MIEERLLVRLRERANARGTVSVRGETLVQEAESTTEAVSAALAKLERTGLLTILSPFPYLVVKLRPWRGRGSNGTDPLPASYGYSGLSNIRLNESHRPADQALLHEILDTLGESDPTTFKGAVKNFSPDVIRKALDRVRRARSLRKNRTALFRYLLTKLT